MMSHESMISYYSNNFHALFFKDIGVTNNFTLADFEAMLPYERDIYMMLMKQKVESLNNN